MQEQQGLPQQHQWNQQLFSLNQERNLINTRLLQRYGMKHARFSLEAQLKCDVDHELGGYYLSHWG
jgi:hypothetical protein